MTSIMFCHNRRHNRGGDTDIALYHNKERK